MDPSAAARGLRPGTSGYILIAANLLPLAGVLWWGWSLADVLLLFWAESAVIGFYNVLKLLSLGTWANLFSVPFFILHYGGFMAGHLLFLVGFYVPIASGSEMDLAGVRETLLRLWPAGLALLASHGASFWLNFLRAGERHHVDANRLFAAPYTRIVVMHLAIIGGAFAIMIVGAPVGALALLVVLKTGVDLAAHAAERRRAKNARAADTAASASA